MTRDWIQESTAIRLLIDTMLRAQGAADRDLKGLAENVGRVWQVREADNKRIKTLELKVAFLSGLAFFTAALALGLTLLAFGWWVYS